MLDSFSGPLAKVIKKMAEFEQKAVRMNKAMSGGSATSLVPAKTVPDMTRAGAAAQHAARNVQLMQNNLTQVNNTLNVTVMQFNKITNQVEQARKKQEQFNRTVEQGNSGFDRLLSQAKGLLAAFIGVNTVKSLLNISDESTNASARIALMNDGLQTTAELQERIFGAAQRARTGYLDMQQAVGKLGILARDAFSSSEEIVRFSELMSKSFRVGGASTMEQQAGMYQLTQAMAAGKLQGDEFRSIMENAPLLAQAIADFTGKSVGDLKEMSAEGTITADIIRGAMFAAADQIEERFANMPRTWSDVVTQVTNIMTVEMGPAIQKMSTMLNDERMQQNIYALGQAFGAAAIAILYLVNYAGQFTGFVIQNWPMISPLVYGVVGALTAMYIWTKANALATKLFSQSWKELNRVQRGNVIIVIISLLITLGYYIYNLWKTNDKFAAGLLRAWNGILNFFDRVPGYFWQLVEWLTHPFEWWAKSVGKIYDVVINGIIKGINKVLELVNEITGSSYKIAAEFSFENVAKGLREYAQIRKESAFATAAGKAAEREQKVLEFLDNRAAKRAQKKAEQEKMMGFDLSGWDTSFDSINKVGEVGRIRDTVDISSEDLKLMRELAEVNAIQNFVTLQPQMSFGDTHIRQDGRTVDEIVANITERLNEEIASSAKGVFRLA